MSQYMNHELLVFFCSVWHGAFLLILYDVLRIFRLVVRHGKMQTAAEDFFFWLGASVYLLVCFYRENSGMLRGYLFIGIVLGMCAWHWSLSRYFVMYLSKIFIQIRKILGIPLYFGKKFIKRLKLWVIRGRISIYNRREKHLEE